MLLAKDEIAYHLKEAENLIIRKNNDKPPLKTQSTISPK